MRIISFGWTAEKVLSGKKTVTRRAWQKAWVKPGDLVQAYTKGPHRGGRKMGILRILKITKYKKFPWGLNAKEALKEGFMFKWQVLDVLMEGGITKNQTLYRVEFEPVGTLTLK